MTDPVFLKHLPKHYERPRVTLCGIEKTMEDVPGFDPTALRFTRYRAQKWEISCSECLAAIDRGEF